MLGSYFVGHLPPKEGRNGAMKQTCTWTRKPRSVQNISTHTNCVCGQDHASGYSSNQNPQIPNAHLPTCHVSHPPPPLSLHFFLFFHFPSPPPVLLSSSSSFQGFNCFTVTTTQRKENPSLSVTYANEKLGINYSPEKPNSWRLLYFCLSSFFSLRKPFPSAGFVSLGILRVEIGGKALLFGLELGL
jgi:hypothetical protein